MSWNSRESLVTKASSKNAFFQRAKHMGAWLIVRGTTVTGALLSATEFFGYLFARYNVNPPNIQNKYDGCMQTFLGSHTLNWTNGGIVIAHHNEIRNDIIHLKKNLSPLTEYVINP